MLNKAKAIDYPSLKFEEAGDLIRDIKAYCGMQIGKYTVVEQQYVGIDLKATK
jgi:hypothetical protein